MSYSQIKQKPGLAAGDGKRRNDSPKKLVFKKLINLFKEESYYV